MEQLDLSSFFATKAEANDFLTRITKLSEMMFQTDFQLEKALTDQFGINKSDRFLTLLRENNINATSLPAVKDFLHAIIEKIPMLPVLSIAIAFEPREQTMKALSEWFLVNTHSQMVFDITADPKLVAGSTITYKGKFFDFSIRPIVERILTTTLTRKNENQGVTPEKPKEAHQDINNISLGR